MTERTAICIMNKVAEGEARFQSLVDTPMRATAYDASLHPRPAKAALDHKAGLSVEGVESEEIASSRG